MAQELWNSRILTWPRERVLEMTPEVTLPLAVPPPEVPANRATMCENGRLFDI